MKYLLYFFIGVVLAAGIHLQLITGCNDSGPTNTNGTEQSKIEEAGQKIEEAFLSGDPKKVEALLTEQAAEVYKSELETIDPQLLKKFGEDFKNRTLDSYAERYAEFTFPWKSTKYVVQLAKQDDGSYKLMSY